MHMSARRKRSFASSVHWKGGILWHVRVQVLDWKADLCTKNAIHLCLEADFDEMIPLIEKELEEVKNKKKQNKKPKNDETNNEEMEA